MVALLVIIVILVGADLTPNFSTVLNLVSQTVESPPKSRISNKFHKNTI